MAEDARKQLIDGLNKDLEGEFQAIIMYRLYASMVQGPYRQELRTFFANEIPEELAHAQLLADKISALGGIPSATPAPVKVVSDAKAMLEAALQAELETIERYVKRRKQAEEARRARAGRRIRHADFGRNQPSRRVAADAGPMAVMVRSMRTRPARLSDSARDRGRRGVDCAVDAGAAGGSGGGARRCQDPPCRSSPSRRRASSARPTPTFASIAIGTNRSTRARNRFRKSRDRELRIRRARALQRHVGICRQPAGDSAKKWACHEQAVEIASANSALQRKPITLVPAAKGRRLWKSAFERDPFDVSIDDKIQFLLTLNEAAMKRRASASSIRGWAG